MLLQLDSTQLTNSAQQVINELEVLDKDKSGGAVTRFLDKEAFNLEQAKKDVSNSLTMILSRRKWILQELK